MAHVAFPKGMRKAESLYNLCLYKLIELAGNAGKSEIEFDEVDRMVVLLARAITPNDSPEQIRKQIENLATNSVYGFSDDIPF